MRFIFTVHLIFFCCIFSLKAQIKPEALVPKELNISRITSPIVIDGKLDELAWENVEIAKKFHQYFPFDSSYAQMDTEVRVAYDDNFLYIGAICKDTTVGKQYISSSLRRDFFGNSNDNFSVVLDPFQDKINGFLFGVNPYGVQREGLISSGSNESFDLSWDNKWYSEASIQKGFWVAEMAIPFKTLRFKGGATRWNINFFRVDSKTNERSAWTPVPRNQPIFSLTYASELVWNEPVKKTGANVSLIPYLSGGAEQDLQNNKPQTFSKGIGGDAKIAITPSLNLDLTVNPDFSQVEVDRQVTNLDRFEIFFPERRQFFLENADLFSNFGFERSRPFFSRRIGVAIDSSTGQNIQNPILFGARLSGKINKDWRVGFLTMQTDKDQRANVPSTNFSVAALQRRIFKRSNIALIMVNKQEFTNKADNFTLNPENYNRLVGLDYNLASADNKWTGKFLYHQVFSPQEGNEKYSYGAKLNYNSANFQFGADHMVIGNDFNPEVGYVPRKANNREALFLSYITYPKSKIINRHNFSFYTEVFWNKQYGTTDYAINPFYVINFQNNGFFAINFWRYYTYLFRDFDPTNTGGKALAQNTSYVYDNIDIRFSSDFRRKFYYDFRHTFGQYYNGNIAALTGNFYYRYKQYALISLNYSYNRISLPEPYATADLFLLGPRFDLTFTKNLFFTTLLQYNNQIENINVNARLQWRFKPVSDFFLVFTDNYDSTNFKVKNWSLVAKFTYWLNL
ncbi:MAG: hydrolase [Bacteroidetes bacterium]|nr:MAG: hydrolase [Bacteroidota bacterium]